ncbi:hypothetical protein ASPWEDRAFT_169669 [Aspergillus wentii DTO 134E9]|uniref:Uncharacterized protein n=1 Tax=Aspergillus wentii DTO 134E9 TaxID=1073089 RepID=A0A1L9RY66_ASPWE|nr:uncharacterized protein ASPWEDRAFT_169669 [Aspergillus wentii DTO 134E9]KAI9931486.1 hypothetical protein MW887_010061 [Aspergillus wentii]OJJ39845.1 hypothetical protein ASPWEDRAFT_169669 [Aspergillus wentii DTO 134E9]
MVNWKADDATDRLIAALIAAHPGLKIDYAAIAAMFGQDATYDAVEGRFRRYRKMADDLRSDARTRGIAIDAPSRSRAAATPRTPRTPRTGGRVSKPSSLSLKGKEKGKDGLETALTTPTKSGKKNGMSPFDAICLDEGAGGEANDTEAKIKIKNDDDDEARMLAKRAALRAATTFEATLDAPLSPLSPLSGRGGMKKEEPADDDALFVPGLVESVETAPVPTMGPVGGEDLHGDIYAESI